MPKGTLIILTGINGAGKDTLAPLVAERLDGVGGLPSQFIYAPKVTPSSTAFRAAVLEGRPESLFAEFLGYMAQHAESAKYLADLREREPQHLVINRGPETALIYNAVANQLPESQRAIARDIYYEITGILLPTATVLLEVSLEESRHRSAQQAETDYIQERGDEYYRRMIDGYQSLAAADPDQWAVIDANQPVDTVLDAIQTQVLDPIFNSTQE